MRRERDGLILKVILETCLLTDEEKARGARLTVECGADFVKTSTGFSKGGATLEDVALLARTVAGKIGVKASGGIRDAATARAMIAAGATRLGTSSGVGIVREVEIRRTSTESDRLDDLLTSWRASLISSSWTRMRTS